MKEIKRHHTNTNTKYKFYKYRNSNTTNNCNNSISTAICTICIDGLINNTTTLFLGNINKTHRCRIEIHILPRRRQFQIRWYVSSCCRDNYRSVECRRRDGRGRNAGRSAPETHRSRRATNHKQNNEIASVHLVVWSEKNNAVVSSPINATTDPFVVELLAGISSASSVSSAVIVFAAS